MSLPQIDNYRELFYQDIPLLDVRAPIEFDQGAFPCSTNLPLMNDEERHDIGIRYKEQGQEQAIALGHERVSAEVKQERVKGWVKFTEQHPHGALYCFRGGMRSKICQQWIYESTGTVYPRVKGGYKALRRFLITELETVGQHLQPWILGGRTGTGKTLLLTTLKQQIDLEGIFHHRGSAFGRHCRPQPAQIDIENTLAIAILKLRMQHTTRLIIEDEAANIGSRCVPKSLLALIKGSPLVLLEADIQQRIDNVFDEYITQSLLEYSRTLGETNAFDAWAGNLLDSLARIQRRLGGQRYKQLRAIMEDAILRHRKSADSEHHKRWIELLLVDYYDPMYDYQLAKKADRIIFRGHREALVSFLAQRQID